VSERGKEVGDYIIEVQPGSETRIVRLLETRGVSELRTLGMGYLSARFSSDQLPTVRGWRGVRAVLPSSAEEHCDLTSQSAASPIVQQALVKLQRGDMAVVGLVKEVSRSDATVVFTLLGRPVEQVCRLTDLEVVEAPEVWR
jgi:hypothetical protein